LFVTGAFNFSGAGLAAARDEEGFAFGAAFTLGAVLGAVWPTVLVAALTGVFALLSGLAAAGFLTTGFAIDLLAADLVAANFGFFTASVVFAGFFIAFAMESIPTGLLSLRRVIFAPGEPMNPYGSVFARATSLDFRSGAIPNQRPLRS
jgi:hypothetical protein